MKDATTRHGGKDMGIMSRETEFHYGLQILVVWSRGSFLAFLNLFLRLLSGTMCLTRSEQ